jgi:V8-like Glu-specific endopeptidase
MIGPHSVLTAGHCVYNRKRKLWQEDLKFVPFR